MEQKVEHAMLEAAAASQEPPLKRCHGGILPPMGRSPLGVKRALFEGWLRQQQRVSDALDPLRLEQKDMAKRKLEINRLTRNFNADLEHLSEEERSQVKEGRTRFLLGKFWGLMHEEDRPWHYHTILHLCCHLPKLTRDFYRKLKPASMQRILSRRAQLEKLVKECGQGVEEEQRRLRRLETEVRVMRLLSFSPFLPFPFHPSLLI